MNCYQYYHLSVLYYQYYINFHCTPHYNYRGRCVLWLTWYSFL